MNDSGSGSLREAIANALPGDTIVLDADGVLSLTSGELEITNDLNIFGPGADKLAISGNTSSRIFEIASGSKVSVRGLTLTQGHAADGGWAWVWYPGGPYTPRPGDNGGAIYNAGILTLSNCAILNSSAGAGGFLWYNYYASASYGAAGGSGGGIYWELTGDLTLNLRSERSDRARQRVYTIMVECTDASGNKSTGMVQVSVAPEPHPKSPPPAVLHKETRLLSNPN